MTRAPLRTIGAAAILLAGTVVGAGGLAAQGFASADPIVGISAGSPADVRPAADTQPTDAPTPPAAPLRIMALGDSITYGVGSKTSSSYRVDLRKRLQSAGMQVDFVGSRASGAGGVDLENEGHPGWVISELRQQIDGWMFAHTPDAVLLMAGTNDIARGLDLETAPNRLSNLIARIRTGNPATHVFVAKIVGTKFDAWQKRVDAFNAKIPAIVAAQGDRVHLVDQSTVDGLDLRDTLHPDDVGYAKMSYNWFRAMEKVYNTTGTPWPEGVNPYKAAQAYHCALVRPVVRSVKAATDCRWWSLRSVTSTVNGSPVTVRRWQTQRTVAETYRAWVKGKYVMRTRVARKWSNT